MLVPVKRKNLFSLKLFNLMKAEVICESSLDLGKRISWILNIEGSRISKKKKDAGMEIPRDFLLHILLNILPSGWPTVQIVIQIHNDLISGSQTS